MRPHAQRSTHTIILPPYQITLYNTTTIPVIISLVLLGSTSVATHCTLFAKQEENGTPWDVQWAFNVNPLDTILLIVKTSLFLACFGPMGFFSGVVNVITLVFDPSSCSLQDPSSVSLSPNSSWNLTSSLLEDASIVSHNCCTVVFRVTSNNTTFKPSGSLYGSLGPLDRGIETSTGFPVSYIPINMVRHAQLCGCGETSFYVNNKKPLTSTCSSSISFGSCPLPVIRLNTQ